MAWYRTLFPDRRLSARDRHSVTPEAAACGALRAHSSATNGVTARPPLRRLVDRRIEPLDAPPHIDHEAVNSDLGLLGTVSEDRLVTPDEVAALVELANSSGLRLDDLWTLHESYAMELLATPMADGVLSSDEHRDLGTSRRTAHRPSGARGQAAATDYCRRADSPPVGLQLALPGPPGRADYALGSCRDGRVTPIRFDPFASQST